MRANWGNARSICKAYGMDIASLETYDEFSEVKYALPDKRNSYSFTDYIHIGGATSLAKTKSEWYWVTSGNKVSYTMPFSDGEPNNAGSIEYCLALGPPSKYYFDDIYCYNYDANFICQKEW